MKNDMLFREKGEELCLSAVYLHQTWDKLKFRTSFFKASSTSSGEMSLVLVIGATKF